MHSMVILWYLVSQTDYIPETEIIIHFLVPFDQLISAFGWDLKQKNIHSISPVHPIDGLDILWSVNNTCYKDTNHCLDTCNALIIEK